MKAIIIGAMLALTVATAGAAEDPSANTFLPACKALMADKGLNAFQAFRAGACAGIIQGISMMGRLMRLNSPQEVQPGCMDIPDAVTPQQQIRVVVRYIDARPARMHERFDGLAAEALVAAWPCRPSPAEDEDLIEEWKSKTAPPARR